MQLHPILRAAFAPLLPPAQQAEAFEAIKPCKRFRIDHTDASGHTYRADVWARSSCEAVVTFAEANPSAVRIHCQLADEAELAERIARFGDDGHPGLRVK